MFLQLSVPIIAIMLPSAKELLSRTKEDKPEKAETNDQTTPKRERTFAAERNQFVVHIHYAIEDEDNLATRIINTFGDEANETIEFMTTTNTPHITFVRGHYTACYHQIDQVMAQLTDVIQNTKAFYYCLSKVDLFPNEDRSRYFIVLSEVQDDAEEKDMRSVSKQIKTHLVQSLHRVLVQTNCRQIFPVDQALIDSFKLHTSIACLDSKHLEDGKKMVEDISTFYDSEVLLVNIDRLTVNIGHRTKTIHLAK